jgi:23S rRNA-/tRNA-specific pseudouridylate synthase
MGPAVAAAVRRAFAAGAVAKTYFAFVRQGRLLGKERWSDGMEKIYKEGKLRAIKSDLRRALTDVIFRGGRRFGTYPLALLELRPITGRTHQLRFQCARHSFPILGDRTYGDFSFNRSVAGTLGCKGLQLHGAKISLRYGLNGHTHVFAADSPKAEIFTNWEKFSKVLPKNF